MDHRALRGRDDADPAWEGRQRSLARRVEQAFGLELGAQTLELGGERPFTSGDDGICVELRFAPVRVERDATVGDDLCAVHKVLAAEVAAEVYGLELVLGVLEREVAVTRAGRKQVGDLSSYPDVAEVYVAVEYRSDVLGDLADAVDLHEDARGPYAGRR